jgi:hypothetical protein
MHGNDRLLGEIVEDSCAGFLYLGTVALRTADLVARLSGVVVQVVCRTGILDPEVEFSQLVGWYICPRVRNVITASKGGCDIPRVCRAPGRAWPNEATADKAVRREKRMMA